MMFFRRQQSGIPDCRSLFVKGLHVLFFDGFEQIVKKSPKKCKKGIDGREKRSYNSKSQRAEMLLTADFCNRSRKKT